MAVSDRLKRLVSALNISK